MDKQKREYEEISPMGGDDALPQHQPTINVHVHNQNIQQQGQDIQQQNVSRQEGLSGRQIYTKLTGMEILGHLIIWIIISIFTLGIGALFSPYATAKLILDSIVIEKRTISCDLGAGDQIVHIIIWVVLILLTGGLAFPFWVIDVWRKAINASRIV